MEGKDFPLSPMQGPSIDPSSFRPASISQGRVPLQEPVSSASPMPSEQSKPPTPTIRSQVASARYIHQFHAVLDRQTQAFGSERALWQTERSDLNDRITHLEIRLKRLSETTGPGDTTAIEKSSSASSEVGNDGSRHTSSSLTGNEVWYPRSSQPPSRVFSDHSSPGTHSPRTGGRLPSVAENPESGRKTSLSEGDASGHTSSQPLHHKASISGHLISKDLDGIQFKVSGLPPSIVQAVLTPQSNSDSGSSSTRSPSQDSPNTAVTPPRQVTLPKDQDPYLKDAGHTPLARDPRPLTSGDNSGGSTPTKLEKERPLLEPHATRDQVHKMPSEKKDSYFPPPPEQPAKEQQDNRGSDSIDEDPALEGPLGLTNDPEGERNKSFMKALDKKLSSMNLRSEAATEEDSSAISEPSASQSSDMLSPSTQGKQKENQNGDEKGFEHPDEPGLRLKRSINFGSQFGAKDLGRGFAKKS